MGGSVDSLLKQLLHPNRSAVLCYMQAKLVPPFLKVDTPGGSFSGSFVRGPAVANIGKLRGTWQLAAVGKPAAAAVLTDLKVQKINSGEWQSKLAACNNAMQAVLTSCKVARTHGCAELA